MTNPQMRVKTICIYPIKSIRGCSPPSLIATATGFNYDRRFMLQRVSDEKNMGIARFNELCLFTTELSPADNPENVLVRYTIDHVFKQSDEKVEDEALEIPLEPDWQADELKERDVDLHGSPTRGYEMADRYNEWFSKRLGYEVRLLYVGENRRTVIGNFSPNSKALSENGNAKLAQGWFGAIGGLISSVTGHGGDQENEGGYKGVDQGIGFADVAPFLVVSEKSWENAAARLDADLDINKFRPNIVVEGAEEAFEEDFWAEIAIGEKDTRLVLTTNCARCPSLNVDFKTGQQGEGDTGKVLKSLQKDRRVDRGMKYSPVFGRYGFLAKKGPVEEKSEIELKLGDSVTVVRRNTERTRFRKLIAECVEDSVPTDYNRLAWYEYRRLMGCVRSSHLAHVCLRRLMTTI